MNLGEPHPMLAVYRMCKEFGWNPSWLEDQKVKGKVFGVIPFEFTIPGIPSGTITLLLTVQDHIDKELEKKVKDVSQ